MKNKYGQSPLWTYINQTRITQETSRDLSNFKSGEANFKLALWNPGTNGVRYLKALIYNLCASLSTENWNKLSRIHNREVGNPIAVRYNGELVCMDYLQSVYELEFIEKNIDLDGLSVLEIGAGYGRTCHAIMSNHEVTAYYIIDLENSLNIASEYLRVVLDQQQFKKLHFVSNEDVDEKLKTTAFDLGINIDSFAEMSEETVRNYFAFINQQCHYFFVKNPVGKYMDKSLDDHSQGKKVTDLALSTGLLREIIDIHDNQAVETHAELFVSTYKPNKNWKCLANGWAIPWSYYWQAFYQKEAM